MDLTNRRQRIIDRLRPKPIHHGQLETFLIAVPDLAPEDIAPERWQVIKDSFEQEGSNLIPVIVRRTETYEEEEYECIYGSDWCLVARELDIERLWVWVFDLTDEQAKATQAEVEILLGQGVLPPSDQIKQIGSLLQRFEMSIKKEMLQQQTDLVSTLADQFEALLLKQLNPLQDELHRLSWAVAYTSMTVKQLQELAKEKQVEKRSKMNKRQLIEALTAVR